MASVQQLFRADKKQKVIDAAAAEKPLSSGNKEQDKLLVEQQAQQIADLQEILYAERKHKILIVLQGMDTVS